jgi:hypothetical protein
MKTLFICNIKSFVDIITNSSSEIFICSGNKEKEAVEQILRKLLENHNELTSDYRNYDDCFGNIEIAEYGFDTYAVPVDILEEYAKYHYVSGHRDCSIWDNPEYKEIQEKEKEAQAKMGIVEGLYQKDAVKYSELTDKWYKSKERKKIWEKYNKKSKDAQLAMFKWFCEYNKIEGDFEAFEKRLDEGGYIPYDSKEPLDKAYSEMKQLLSYNIHIQKGQIVILSKSDNTIPYELFGCIESYLGAERYHIG